jgi:hypothetical protein
MLNNKDDSKSVEKKIKLFFKDKDLGYLTNLYGGNSGNYNSGDCNSGNHNSGNYNSGDCNSGDCNSGNHNSGYRNSGNHNSGDRNSGNHNSGNYNSGYRNSGNYNSGDCNSGNCNSGNHNSGDRNSGNYNNSGDGYLNSFSSDAQHFLFNKPCTEEEYREIYNLNIDFNVCKFVWESDMTDKEKENNPTYKITGGYIKKIPYKDVWATVPKNKIEQIKKLKNFDADIFFEISGIRI